MQAANFLLETLGHFITLDASPPPGVPVHAGDDFEKELTALCQAQSLAPIVLDSFDKLSLTPRLSRIALERLRAMAQDAARRSAHMLKLGAAVGEWFADAEIPCLFIGEFVAARDLYPASRLRRIDAIELLVREADWQGIAALLKEQGFSPPPGIGTLSAPGEVLEYHQYVAPCVFRNHRGDAISLRFRMHAYGPPDETGAVWSRAGAHLPGGDETAVASLEDRLMRSVLDWNGTGMTNLLMLVDIGLLLLRSGKDCDWRYITHELDRSGFYGAFYLTLEHARRLLRIQPPRALPGRPGAIRRKFFKTVWYPKTDAYADDGRGRNPLKHFLLECGRPDRKLLLLKRMIAPRDVWITTYFSRPVSAWLRLKLTVMLLSGRTRRARRYAGPD